MQSQIWRITLDTNPEDCNLHCIMCEEHSEFSKFQQKLYEKTGIHRRIMPKPMIAKVIREAVNLGVREIIPTTMGDPLLTDNFEFIAELVKEQNLKLNITHNGTFPRKSVEEWASLIVPLTVDVKFSLNGASANTAENIMKGLNFNKSIQNIQSFIQFRNIWAKEKGHYCKVTLQLTFMKNNIREIESIIRLAGKLGVDRIKGHHLWVHFDEIRSLSLNYDEESISFWNKTVEKAQQVANECLNINGDHIILENFFPITKEPSNFIPNDFYCPFLGKELWISATGKISPCCAPDELRDHLGNYGNINETTLAEVINSYQYKFLIENYKNHYLCKNCSLRKP